MFQLEDAFFVARRIEASVGQWGVGPPVYLSQRLSWPPNPERQLVLNSAIL